MRKSRVLILALTMLAMLGIAPVRADDAEHQAAGRVRSVTHEPATITVFNKEDGQTTYTVDLWRMNDDTRHLLWDLHTGDAVSLHLLFNPRWNQWRVVSLERNERGERPMKKGNLSQDLFSPP
ncbi:MAG TPA: hypothetical protein VGO93_17145 [Candidatus Xenobia bacterium]|jgi:hypothetical protein